MAENLRELSDDALVELPEKTRDSTSANAATLEMLRRLKASLDQIVALLSTSKD